MRYRIAVLTIMSCCAMPAQVIHGPQGGAAGAPPPKTLRYVNPLPVEDTQKIGDPCVLRFQGKYYLYLSGGLA